jgi:asparagine synthase (glutamine-hydrolysing)|tara:strand:- start:15139 stop:16884 length:1746 start_codon:yes stop_codon:yes gene_type:complete
MCGIFVVIPKKDKKLDIDRCTKSLRELKRRGPDWSFYKVIENIFFGQTILSMTGKNEKNIDNHFSNSKKYFLVFNGEIYNYKNISSSTPINKNISDTKVLIDLFDGNDPRVINSKLDGMYAYIVLDKEKKKLFISRDPQGEKSIYKYENSDYIIFSSEIKPIIQFTGDNELNEDIIKSYFLSRHFIQFDKTIYKKIKNIQPGEFWEYSINSKKLKKTNTLSIRSYVNEKDYKINDKKSENDLVEELDYLLQKNLKEMTPKNRNFSSIISGGVDSSLISILLKNLSKSKNFITLNHIGKDRISNKVKLFEKYLENPIFKINVSKTDYKNYLLKSVNICSSPVSSHDFSGKLIIAKKTNEMNCKAVFGGDGADELFGGYATYLQPIKDIKKNLSDYSRINYSSLLGKNYKNNFYEKKLEKDWRQCLKVYNFLNNKTEQNRQAMMLMDSSLQLSSVGLRGCDLMSMHYSIEPRSVFLRKSIIKFALNLPIRFKLSNNQNTKLKTKVLLKKLFLKYYPEKLLFKKQGFAGFPNEMKRYLGESKKYRIKKMINIDNFDKRFKKLRPAEIWKVLNLEFFIRDLNKKI